MSAIRREEIRRRLDAGENQSQIANDLGISRQRIWQLLNPKVPAPRPAALGEPGSSKPNWRCMVAAERDRLLADFCAKNLTASQIAAHFDNCSRSAVLGRLRKINLSLTRPHGTNQHTTRKYKPRGETKAAKAPRKRTVRTAKATSWRGANNPHHADIKARAEQRAASPGLPAHLVAGEARKPIAISDGVPTYRNLTLVELTERTCKWPLGDSQSPNFAFCGNDAAEAGPYCKYHARVAYIPATVRQRASLRSAERIS